MATNHSIVVRFVNADFDHAFTMGRHARLALAFAEVGKMVGQRRLDFYHDSKELDGEEIAGNLTSNHVLFIEASTSRDDSVLRVAKHLRRAALQVPDGNIAKDGFLEFLASVMACKMFF